VWAGRCCDRNRDRACDPVSAPLRRRSLKSRRFNGLVRSGARRRSTDPRSARIPRRRLGDESRRALRAEADPLVRLLGPAGRRPAARALGGRTDRALRPRAPLGDLGCESRGTLGSQPALLPGLDRGVRAPAPDPERTVRWRRGPRRGDGRAARSAA
jgi:hypothetical protein